MAITLDGTDGITTSGDIVVTGNGSVKIPTGTTAQRPDNPANGYMRYNTTTKSIEIYHESISSWNSDFSGSLAASGGTESTMTENNVAYKVHAFTSSGNFVVTRPGDIEYLVVGGGGSGVSGHVGTPAGGDGGGQTEGTASVSIQTYSIVVGAGGAGWTSVNNGSSSSAFGDSSSGGVYGTNTTGGDGADGSLYSKFIEYGTTSANVNGGGGYFGGQGGDNGADRGDGYAGRGGAGGGGRAGHDGSGYNNGENGYANSGGGGGAGDAQSSASGSGGSGIVIIRYPI